MWKWKRLLTIPGMTSARLSLDLGCQERSHPAENEHFTSVSGKITTCLFSVQQGAQAGLAEKMATLSTGKNGHNY